MQFEVFKDGKKSLIAGMVDMSFNNKYLLK